MYTTNEKVQANTTLISHNTSNEIITIMVFIMLPKHEDANKKKKRRSKRSNSNGHSHLQYKLATAIYTHKHT